MLYNWAATRLRAFTMWVRRESTCYKVIHSWEHIISNRVAFALATGGEQRPRPSTSTLCDDSVVPCLSDVRNVAQL